MTIELKDLTSGDTTGSGSFDALMRSVKAHLTAEYDAGRITGNDYATVYLSALQAAMTTAAQFTLTKDKANIEVVLYEQKILTEEAQTQDTIGDSDAVVTGVLGKKNALFEAQTDGFARDAEQKIAKMYLDTWSVRQTTDGEDAPSAGVDNPTIKEVLAIAKQGIGLS